MKKYMAMCLCLFALFLTNRAADAVVIELAPSAQSVALGLPAPVQLRISGLGANAAPSLGAFDVDVTFDSSIIALASVNFGDPGLGDQLDLFGLGSITSTTPGAGTVNLFELSLDLASDLDDLQADSFVLATLLFDSLSVGASGLSITFLVLSDADGSLLDATIENASVEVTGRIPLPAAAWLFLTAVCGLGLFGSRRTHATA